LALKPNTWPISHRQLAIAQFGIVCKATKVAKNTGV
jgi:hypothetical protein